MLPLLLGLALAAPLTLPQAAAEARAHGPAAALVEQELRAEQAAVWAASVGQSQAQLGLLASPTWSEWTLQVPLGMLLPVRPQALSAGRDLAGLRAVAARLEVVGAVLVAYLELARAQAVEALSLRLEDVAQGASRAAKARMQAGELDPGQAALLAADAARALDAARRASRARVLAALRLEALLGREPEGTAQAEGWPVLSAPPRVSAEEALAVALAQQEQRAAVAEHNAARLNALPPLFAVGGVEVEAGGLAPLVGFTLSAPNPGSFASARAADAHAEAAALDLSRTRLETAAALAEAQTSLELAESALAAWAEVPTSTALEALEARSLAGEWSVAEILAARALLLDAGSAQAEAQVAVAQARWDLWALSGELPPELR